MKRRTFVIPPSLYVYTQIQQRIVLSKHMFHPPLTPAVSPQKGKATDLTDS